MKAWEIETERYKYIEALRNGDWWLISMILPHDKAYQNRCVRCDARFVTSKPAETCRCGGRVVSTLRGMQEILDSQDMTAMRAVSFQKTGYGVMKVDTLKLFEGAKNMGVQFVQKFESLNFAEQQRAQNEGRFIREVQIRIVNCRGCRKPIAVVGDRELCSKCRKTWDAALNVYEAKRIAYKTWCEQNLTMQLCEDGIPERWCGRCAARVQAGGPHRYW